MKFKTILLFFLTTTYVVIGQEQETLPKTLHNQFEELYKKSSSYQVYKVISKEKYRTLQQNVSDSIRLLKNTILQKEKEATANTTQLRETQNALHKVEEKLKIAIAKENTMSLLGFSTSKQNYNITLWFLIVVLLIGLGYFIFKFIRSNRVTKDAKNNLIEVEKEFEIHRKKSLEREQKLRRKLQDEINKQRN